MYADNGITDVRGETAAIMLRRVRTVGFDVGAGNSVAMYLDSAALLAMSCRFEGGYGRSPTSGNLVNTRSPFVAPYFPHVLQGVFSGFRTGH